MAKFLKKLRELRNADVRYISLVDRAATRIPFRVLKREEGEDMGLDLSKIFKSDQKPEVVAMVIREKAEKVASDSVRIAIQKAGFAVDKVKKAENAVIYVQKENEMNASLVRLSPDVAVAIKGMEEVSKDFPDMVSSDGFYTGLAESFDVVQKSALEILENADSSETASTQLTTLLQDFSQYAGAMAKNIPLAVWKADFAINKVLVEAKKADITTADLPKPEEKKPEAAAAAGAGTAPAQAKPETAPPATPPEPPSGADAKQQPDETAKKFDTLLESLQSIAKKVDGFETKFTDLANQQEAQKKILDDVSKKSETLSEKLSTTVITSTRADNPANGTATKKADRYDNDPRTGAFDTAFLPRNRAR